MRQYDPTLELVACGSSHRSMPTFGTWEATVLDLAYDVVDYISAHAYYEIEGDDLASFLASSLNMESFIHDVVSTADHVAARLSTTKRINISFDEWNVWYVKEMHERDLPKDWTVAPRLSEDAYTVADAVVVGSLLVTLLRNSDRVTSACQAQLVNAIGSIRTEPGGPAWRQSIFHPFAQMAALAKGTVLRTEIKAPTYNTSRYGEAPVVDVAATYDEERNELVLFVVNRHPGQPVTFTANLRAFPGARLEAATVLADDDWRAANTQEQPDRVVPRPHPDATVDEGTLRAVLPPVSWNVFRLPSGAS
jgi:alpha-N-arabinofuranosidase